MAPACGRRSALAERRGRKWRRWRPGRRRRAATARARTPSVRAGASPRALTPKWRCWPSTCSSRCPRTGRSRPGLSWRRWPTCRPSSVSPRAPSALSTCPDLSAPSLPSDEPHHSLSSIAPNIPYYCTTDMLHQPPAPRNAFILGFIFRPFQTGPQCSPTLKRNKPCPPLPSFTRPQIKDHRHLQGLEDGAAKLRTLFR